MSAKKSYSTVVGENTELKRCIDNIKQKYQQYQNNNNKNILTGKENTLGKNNQKNRLRGRGDNEPELEESQYLPEETEKEIEKLKIEKKQAAKKRNKYFRLCK